MTAAVRLWWLLRSTSTRHRDSGIVTSFALITWALLAAAGLVVLAGRQEALDRALLGAVAALVAALAITAAMTARTLLQQTEDRRLAVLRATGATRAQAAVVGALDIADSALPGVGMGILADLALAWLIGFSGADLTPAGPLLLLPVALLTVAAGLLVARRVKAAALA